MCGLSRPFDAFDVNDDEASSGNTSEEELLAADGWVVAEEIEPTLPPIETKQTSGGSLADQFIDLKSRIAASTSASQAQPKMITVKKVPAPQPFTLLLTHFPPKECLEMLKVQS